MPQSVSSIHTVKEIPLPIISDTKENSDKAGTKLVQYPEGGIAAWCTVIGGALVMFCGFGYTASFGVYQDFYTRHYLINESPSAISWIGGISAFLGNTSGLLAGILYDQGYFYHLLIGGSILQSITLFMLSLAQPGQYYQIFLAQGIGLGMAQGIMYVPAMAVVSHYFHKRRTLAMSLVASGASVGSILHPIMLNNLLNRRVGFANGVRISPVFMSILLLIACLIIRTRLEPPKPPANYLLVGKGVLHDVPFCMMCIGLFFADTGIFFPLFYLQLDSIQHGNSETFSFYSFVFLNRGSLIGRLSTGFIAPHVGVPRLMIIATALCGILTLGMMGLNRIPTVVVIGTIYGYFSGVYYALLSPLIALLTRDNSELGVRMGIASMALGIGALIGAFSPDHLIPLLKFLLKCGPASGALLTSQYEWWRPSLFSGLSSVAGASLLLLMQFTMTRRKCTSGIVTP